MIELGGKIFLEGFETLDQAELLIAKKLVGSYVRLACDEAHCERVDISLSRSAEGYTVTVHARGDDDEMQESHATGRNVFMTIDAALKGLLQCLRVEAQ